MAIIAYEVGSLLAMLAWMCLAIAAVAKVIAGSKRWLSALLWFAGRLVPILLSLGYVVLLIVYWGSTPEGDFNSLAGVKALFQSDGNLAGAWLHFLAFDLLVGRWMVDDALQSGRRRWRLVFSMPLTFLYGPLGLVIYLLLGTRLNYFAKQANR